MAVSVTVDLKGVRKKISKEGLGRGRYAMANQMLADMTPFVPMNEGILRQTGQVNSNATQIIWNTPYAAKLFYMPMRNYTTPGTGPRWDNKAKSMFMSEWIKAFMKGAGL